ncbi:hypothetical protein [Actinomyces trachealis]|nr:hypothetical protein [Actinomyces trachealis]
MWPGSQVAGAVVLLLVAFSIRSTPPTPLESLVLGEQAPAA